MRTGRNSVSMRLTTEGNRLLTLLAKRRFISKNALVEQLVRKEAKAEGIPFKEGDEEATTTA